MMKNDTMSQKFAVYVQSATPMAPVDIYGPFNYEGNAHVWAQNSVSDRKFVVGLVRPEFRKFMTDPAELTFSGLLASNDVRSLLELADELDKGMDMDILWVKYQGDLLRRVATALADSKPTVMS